MPHHKIRLFIAEDHTLVLQGYLKLLATNEKIVVEATAVNYYDIIHKLKTHTCDVILLDLSMPMAFRLRHFGIYQKRKASSKGTRNLYPP